MSQVTTEQLVSLPVINPDTGGRSKSFDYMGKIDRVEGSVIIDWKSASDPMQYIHKRNVGLQAEMYALALRDKGLDIHAVEYRIIRTPTIRLCGKDADREAYEERCFEWICGDPGANLIEHRRQLTHPRLEQARALIWEASKRILDSRLNNRWLANENACFAWSRPCDFLPLCEAAIDGQDVAWVLEQNFEAAQSQHDELGDVGAGRDVLTYSSISKLTLCEVFYYWFHERKIRKKRPEFKEALYRGSAMHVGLEAYKDSGMNAAMDAIDEWEERHPVFGGTDDAKKQDQEIARARAMCRAAATKWLVE